MSTATADPDPSQATVQVSLISAGDPGIIGLPIFAAGSVCLGMALVGYVPAAAVGAVLPIVLAATGVGLMIATLWSLALGQTMVAGVYGLFAGFWLSYAMLLLGVLHSWFLVPAKDVPHAEALFLITWAIVMAALTIASLRLPLAFTAVFGLVVLALVLLVPATLNASSGLTHAAGVVVLAFAALGLYLFLGTASTALGGPAYPLGRSLIK
ncbi:MAG: GPR1/FUN34/YaaH family transporter [Actinomycetota bacterium]|nr:GPR1/FUN34/YaaH family transporter [Actinomycetota bacterium]